MCIYIYRECSDIYVVSTTHLKQQVTTNVLNVSFSSYIHPLPGQVTTILNIVFIIVLL